MADDNNIKKFGAADIEKYHKGLLTPAQMHAIEKAVLDDPFLADALEGYDLAGLDISADIASLKKKLEDRTGTKKAIPIGGGRSGFPWLRAAAVVVLVAGTGTLFYIFNVKDNSNKEEIAKSEPALQKDQPVLVDSVTIEKVSTVKVGNPTFPYTTNPSVQNNKIPPGIGSTTVPLDKMDLSQKEDNPVATSNGELNDIKSIPLNPSSSPAPSIAKAKADGEVRNSVAVPITDTVVYSSEVMARQKTAANNASRFNEAYRNSMNVFRGRVTDNNSNGIPFANVTNVQDNVGTYTDSRGYFNLTSPDSILNVQTRALGFNSYNVQLRNNITDNKVVMQEDRSVAAQTLSEKKVNYELRARNPNFKLEGEPEPEDGWDTYDSYLANNVNIPQEFKARQTEATQSQTVEISFEVNKLGEPHNFKVLKSLCAKCDQEAIRLIKEGPKWKRKNKKGRARVTIAF
jgi:hypothetical protein